MPGALKTSTLGILLLLFGCSAQQTGSPQLALKLLPPAEASVAVLFEQKLTLKTSERQQKFLLVARFDKDRLKMALLSPSGLQLLLLDYDGETLVQESSFSIDVPGKEILAIIQFAMWPEQSVKNHYSENNGWLVEITADSRILLTVDKVILKIEFRDGMLIIDNYLRNYRVLVHTLKRKEL